ncbi:MAG: hypothetical protein LC797_19175 [Chloroflexi bacterium]|nr:hypothetical protein [Chloroflexota bacterium]
MSRIGIVYAQANIDTVPSLIGAAEAFAEHGYDVDLFAYTQAGQPAPHFGSRRIRLRPLGVEGLAERSTAGLRGAVKGWLPNVARAPLQRGYRVLGAGLAHGSRLAARARTAVAEPAEPFGRLLAEDNHLNWERVVMVPNAPPGPARRQPARYWHERFDLPNDARVIIHSGSLGDWTGIEAIVDSAPSWPDPWVLVIHTRHAAESSAYVDDLRKRADPRRVWFSLKPVPRQAYDPLIDGADVGLAFYVPTSGSSFTQRNVQTIGLSSGKLAYYLRAGLPVIVNTSATIAEIVEGAGCGISVANAHGIPPALARIAADYSAFSRSATAFFDGRLDFRRAFGEVMRRVDALQGTA